MKQLKLDQTIKNFSCGDLKILFVVIGLGVTRLKKTAFVHLLNFFKGEGEKRGGVISCVWSAFDFANFCSVDVFFTYDEYGFSFKVNWSYSR